MSNRDEWDDKAEKLLPLLYDSVGETVMRQRRAVAAAFREMAEQHKAEVDQIKAVEFPRRIERVTNALKDQIAQLRAEIARLTKPNAEASWIRQEATDSQVTAILNQRDYLLSEIARLKSGQHVSDLIDSGKIR